MAIIEQAQQVGVYRVAARFVERALRRNGSLYGNDPIWTAQALAALDDRFAERLRDGGATFDERWAALLRDAGGDIVALAGEVMHVHVVFAADLSSATKRRLVRGTLERDHRHLRMPPWMEAAFDGGVAGTGVAFKASRLSQLHFLVRSTRAWKRLTPGQRRNFLADPLAYRDWLAGVPVHGGQPQREALLHLVHPEAFEPIVSPRVKRRIVEAFADAVPEGIDESTSPSRTSDVPSSHSMDRASGSRIRRWRRGGASGAFWEPCCSPPGT